MPELPEVEVIRRGLKKLLIHRTVTGICYDNKPLRLPVRLKTMEQLLLGQKIVAVDRRAKYLLIRFDNDAVLILHMGMTGKMSLCPTESPKNVHDHICWYLDDKSELRFNDIRRFGSAQIASPEQSGMLDTIFFNQTGVEPFDKAFNADYLLRQANGKRRPLKNFLMDGKIIAGIGNIYANEALFKAQLNPDRPISSLIKTEWQRLIVGLRTTLTHAISCGGSTISDFANANGTSGYFQINFSVYGRQGTPCPLCQTFIEKKKLGGRATYFCPVCQRR